MLTSEAKAKRVATAQARLDRLTADRAALVTKVERIDKEIRLADLDLRYRKAAPTVEDAEQDTIDGHLDQAFAAAPDGGDEPRMVPHNHTREDQPHSADVRLHHMVQYHGWADGGTPPSPQDHIDAHPDQQVFPEGSISGSPDGYR